MKKYQAEILQAAKMDGSINFQVNGDINVYPCPWEDDKQATDGARVRYRAGIEVDADGRTRVKRYNEGKNGPRHEVLYETAHGQVKMTRPQYRGNGRREISKESIYVVFKFPKKLGVSPIKAMYEEESDEMMAFFKTRKEETVWK